MTSKFPTDFFHWPVEEDLSPGAMTEVKLAVTAHLAKSRPVNEFAAQELENLVNTFEAIEQKRAAKVPGWEDKPETEEWLDI